MLLLTRLGLTAAATVLAVLVPQAAYAAAPDTQIDSGPDNAYLLPGPVQFTFSAIGTSDGFLCSIDDADPGAYTPCTSPQTFDLPYGSHFFRVKAKNGAEIDPTPSVRFWYIRNVPCEQAGQDYAEAQSWYFTYQNKKSDVKEKLHKAQADHHQKLIDKYKKKIKKLNKKIKQWQAAMDAASAQESAVC
jgi:hypothetical protein